MTIVVTGGVKGIGLGIARRLAASGEPMVLGFHDDTAAADAARAEIEGLGARTITVRADVGSPAGAGELMAAAAALGGPIKAIVHSAAMIYPTSLLGADLERFSQAIRTNGLSLLYLVQSALPWLTRGSSVVFITSSGARQALPSYAALGAGKALAESLMRYLVPELAPLGIRINAVAPGLVNTTSVATMLGSEEAAARLLERSAKANPSGRPSRESDYASLVEYLLGAEAAFIQGQVIHANGGAFVG